DIAINKNADRNRSLLFLRKVANTIDWKPVETLLMNYYQIGKSKKGERCSSAVAVFLRPVARALLGIQINS
ncbi:MAG: hypothetical protein GY870_00920, partial [archaeon]|nr:hypothetical protein [archaeon]